jgi:asparagine synthase (glutamine-hydrolysing)
MCGIAGFIKGSAASPGTEPAPRCCLDAMLRVINHRGPDDWGMTFFGFQADAQADEAHVKWIESRDVRVALGHRRLSILDLTTAGRQPMMSRDGAFCITFNGEIYNYVELRSELSRSTEFRTETDTEVLLEAYRRWGVEMLGRLDGMFAFALWDANAKKLVCARDPMGIKPFYFARRDGLFLFASEPRAVLAGLGLPGSVDVVRIAEFLVLGISDHDEGTSYQEVQQLRGGHWFEVDAHGFVSKPTAFWHPPTSIMREDTDVPPLVQEQIELAVRRQLRSDVPVGSCLSGGLDSGSIVATVGMLLGSRASEFKTLTLTSKDFEGDESHLARAMAQRAGVMWKAVEPEPGEVAGQIEEMIRAWDEPFPSLSMFAQRQVMRHARDQGLKVMLNGQGGDEVLLGYPRVAQRVLGEYLWRGRLSSSLQEWRALDRNASQPLASSLAGNIFFGSPRIVRWHNSRRIAKLVDPCFLEQVRPGVAHTMYSNKNGIHGLQVAELTYSCLPQLLRFEDRNSMAYGVEARVPLLSISMVELGLQLPLRWKVRNGWTKYALRVAMEGRLPNEIIWSRRKRGFEVPQRRWVETARPRIAEWLADLPQNCPINGAQILACIDAGQGGEQWLWRCLSVVLWMSFSGVHS